MKQKVDQVRIFITDFEDVYRKGIRWAMSEIESFVVTGEATTNVETLEKIMKTPVDLLIVNTNHTKPSGIDVARYVSHILPGIKVILMMDEYRTEHVVGSMKSGAKTCFSKSINLEGLIQVVNQVIHDELPIGHYLLKPNVAGYILKEYEVSNQMFGLGDKSHISLIQSEKFILSKIRDDISLSNLATDLGISEEIIADYLDEIAEKMVKIEYYNETTGERYISDLVSRHIDETVSLRDEISGSREGTVYSGEYESHVPDDLPKIDNARYDEKEGENIKEKKQSAEPDEAAKDISEVVELARKAGRLSTVQDVNQYIMSITEDLMIEIDRRRRMLRRLKKAIEFEIEHVKELNSAWN